MIDYEGTLGQNSEQAVELDGEPVDGRRWDFDKALLYGLAMMATTFVGTEAGIWLGDGSEQFIQQLPLYNAAATEIAIFFGGFTFLRTALRG